MRHKILHRKMYFRDNFLNSTASYYKLKSDVKYNDCDIFHINISPEFSEQMKVRLPHGSRIDLKYDKETSTFVIIKNENGKYPILWPHTNQRLNDMRVQGTLSHIDNEFPSPSKDIKLVKIKFKYY